MNKVITTYEHEYLSVDDSFTQLHFERMVRYNERFGNKYFTVGHHRIKFQNYVGVFQIGNLTIEVLPKIDNNGTVNKWKNCLLTMLQECNKIDLSAIDSSYLNTRHSSLADIFIEAFLREVWFLVHTGLTKKYMNIEGNLKYLKGRLLFNKHIIQNLIRKELFYTSHQVYNFNNIYNHIIKRALRILMYLNSSEYLRRIAGNLYLHFDNVSDRFISKNNFENLLFDKKTERYHSAISFAKLIILNMSPDLYAGEEDVLAIVFDMNKLFEEFVYINLKRKESEYYQKYKLEVNGQVIQKFWKEKSIRPDIVLDFWKDGQKKRIIIDTKWKVLSEAYPSDEDLKQMYVYNLQFGTCRSVLLYPKTDLADTEAECYHKSDLIAFEHSCSLMFSDFFDSDGKKRDFAKEILSKLLD